METKIERNKDGTIKGVTTMGDFIQENLHLNRKRQKKSENDLKRSMKARSNSRAFFIPKISNNRATGNL